MSEIQVPLATATNVIVPFYYSPLRNPVKWARSRRQQKYVRKAEVVGKWLASLGIEGATGRAGTKWSNYGLGCLAVEALHPKVQAARITVRGLGGVRQP